jgi:hypothetical protein
VENDKPITCFEIRRSLIDYSSPKVLGAWDDMSIKEQKEMAEQFERVEGIPTLKIEFMLKHGSSEAIERFMKDAH